MYNFKQYLKGDPATIACTAVVTTLLTMGIISGSLTAIILFGSSFLLLGIGTYVAYKKAKKYEDHINDITNKDAGNN